MNIRRFAVPVGVALLITAPLWWPVVKALWKEANKALRRDGGILGHVPDARELREIEREERYEEPSMVSVPRDPRRAAAQAAATRRAEGSADRGRPAARRARPAGRRAGFR